MDWNEEITRSNFLLELLMLAEAGNVDTMMDKLFEALVNDGDAILAANEQPRENIERAIEQIIKWFADNERYEECHELKQIKERCLK